jgi:hypothetical protein
MSFLSASPRANGKIECGGCEVKRMLPGVPLNNVRFVSLTDPPPVPAVFFWLLETAERN